MQNQDQELAIKKLVITVFRTNGALLDSTDEKVKPFGLTSAQFQIIGALGCNEAPLTVPQLARFIGVTRQAVQKQLHSLLDKGLIECSLNPCHERSPLHSLSEEGEKLHKSVSELHRKQLDDLIDKFDMADIEHAYETLNRFCEHLILQRASANGDEECCERMNYHSAEHNIFNRI